MGIFNDDTKPYWPLIPILILLTGLMVWMNSYMPPADLAPYGYSSVILAFEFILNSTDLETVLSPLSATQVAGLDMVNNIDFAYMVVYSALLAGVFYITWRKEGLNFLKLGMALAACALFSDLFENFQLLDLTKMYTSSTIDGVESVISNLFIFTWLKWGALAIAMAILVPVLIKRGLFSKVIAFVLAIPVVILVVAAITQSPSIIDKFATTIIFGFLALAIYIIAYRTPQQH